MKTTLTTHLTRSALALALLALSQSAFAQDKGSTRLVQLNASAPAQPAAASSAGMDCPKCKNPAAKNAQSLGKAGQMEPKSVTKAGCPVYQPKAQAGGCCSSKAKAPDATVHVH